jgi:hypothetical protein
MIVIELLCTFKRWSRHRKLGPRSPELRLGIRVVVAEVGQPRDIENHPVTPDLQAGVEHCSTPGTTPRNEPFRLAHLNHGDDCAILLEGGEGPARVKSLRHGALRRFASERQRCLAFAARPIASSQRRTHARQKKPFSGGARSGRRAADQPHRAGQSHSRTVRIGRKRLVNRGDGGRDDLCWLVAQPTVHGADLG